MSIAKSVCENYLFEDYRSKSCIRSRILALAILGRTKRNFPFEIFRNRLIRKFGAFTYKVSKQFTFGIIDFSLKGRVSSLTRGAYYCRSCIGLVDAGIGLLLPGRPTVEFLQ